MKWNLGSPWELWSSSLVSEWSGFRYWWTNQTILDMTGKCGLEQCAFLLQGKKHPHKISKAKKPTRKRMRRQVVLVASIVFTLFVATSYATLMTTKDISLPTYQNCIKLADNNRFYWSVQNDILYGRVIGVGADGGWTAIGFSSGTYSHQSTTWWFGDVNCITRLRLWLTSSRTRCIWNT